MSGTIVTTIRQGERLPGSARLHPLKGGRPRRWWILMRFGITTRALPARIREKKFFDAQCAGSRAEFLTAGFFALATLSVNSTLSVSSETPEHAALADATVMGSDPQRKLVWDAGRPHASDFGAAVRKVAHNAWTGPFAVIDRRRRVPLNPEALAPLASH
jgi:hypothetical protein